MIKSILPFGARLLKEMLIYLVNIKFYGPVAEWAKSHGWQVWADENLGYSCKS